MASALTFALGNFNIPTAQHEKLVGFLNESAAANQSDCAVYLWKSTNSPRQLSDIFPNMDFRQICEAGRPIQENVLGIFESINRQYRNIVFVADKDNVDVAKAFFAEHNGKRFSFESVQVVSSGMANPDLSAKGELPRLVRGSTRDRYHRKEIFNVGDKVTVNEDSDGRIYEIVKRGTNHLLLLAEGGDQIVAKFISDVREVAHRSRVSLAQARNLYEAVVDMTGSPVPNSVTSVAGMVNHAMERLQEMKFDVPLMEKVSEFLNLADRCGVDYDRTLVPAKLNEARTARVAKVRKKSKDNLGQDILSRKDYKRLNDAAKGKVGGSMFTGNDDVRRMKINQHLGESGDVSVTGNPDDIPREAGPGDVNHLIPDSDNFHATKYYPWMTGPAKIHTADPENDANKSDSYQQEVMKNISLHDTTDKTVDDFIDKNLTDHDIWDTYKPSEVSVVDADTHEKVDNPPMAPGKYLDWRNSHDIIKYPSIYPNKHNNVYSAATRESPTTSGEKEDPLGLNWQGSGVDRDSSRFSAARAAGKVKNSGNVVTGKIKEGLSRQERLKRSQRFRRTKANRERKLKLALKRFSSMEVLGRRARRLAVKALKNRLLRGRDIRKMSVAEKERMETLIKKKTDLVQRIAIRLVPKIRQFERERLQNR